MVHLYAILSDIHANFEALEAVERDARAMARQERIPPKNLRFISLGDVVDYGPRPNECMAWVEENVTLAIQGNHDRNVAAPEYEAPDGSINQDYWPITLWTRRTLKKQYKQLLGVWKESAASPSLPGLDRFILFHGNLRFKDQHIKSSGDARPNLEEIEERGFPWGMFGHTHYQGYFTLKADIEAVLARAEDEEFRIGESSRQKKKMKGCPVNRWADLPGEPFRTLLNPGSVGQPRRHPLLKRNGTKYPEASYMLLKVNGRGYPKFQFRRVTYDVEETIRQLEQLRWPPPPAQQKGHDIYKDEGMAEIDPRLEEALKNISQTLPQVVKTLIDKLKTG